jgi:hypothetical protein
MRSEASSARRRLDSTGFSSDVAAMTMLQLKQEISRLSARERRELNAYLIRLRHETPTWRKAISKRMREMDAGKKVTVEELERRISCA